MVVAAAIRRRLSINGYATGLLILMEIGSRRPDEDHLGGTMIANNQERDATLQRIRHLQAQMAHLRKKETNPVNYRRSVAGFLAEIDRMQSEVREYFSFHPAEQAGST